MRHTDQCIRLPDFVAWRKLCIGTWYADPVNGKVYLTRNGEELKFQKSPSGYLRTSVRYYDKYVSVLKHRVIWMAAHGRPLMDTSLTIDHINGNKEDSRIENLQLLPMKENIQKSMRMFTRQQVQEIRKKRKEGATCIAIAKEYGASAEAIRKICSRYSYRDVMDDE